MPGSLASKHWLLRAKGLEIRTSWHHVRQPMPDGFCVVVIVVLMRRPLQVVLCTIQST